MGIQTNQENTSFNDQSINDQTLRLERLAKGIEADVTDDEEATSEKSYGKNLMNKGESEVRENEDASLQDDSYSFDESNTDNEEYHDAGDADEDELDFDNDDDYVQ